MRCFVAFFVLTPVLLLAERPLISASISREDIRGICNVIRVVTPDPVLSISRERDHGKRAVVGPPNEIVSVRTGYVEKGTGGYYYVQKVGGVWKVLHQGTWRDDQA